MLVSWPLSRIALLCVSLVGELWPVRIKAGSPKSWSKVTSALSSDVEILAEDHVSRTTESPSPFWTTGTDVSFSDSVKAGKFGTIVVDQDKIILNL